MDRSILCVLCGGRARRPLFTINDNRFWKCPECGLIQMHPLPKGEAAGEDYAGFDLDSYRRFMAIFRVPQYERDLSSIQKHLPRGRLLDVGCGLGEFLAVAEKRGFQAFGLEPSRNAYEIVRKDHAVVRGELKNVSFKEGFFDAVTLWSVLEHVPAPGETLDRIHALLKTGGILALRVPDARGLLPSLALRLYQISLGRVRGPLRVIYQLDWHYKHYFNYRRGTLGRLLEKHGFNVLEVRSENSFDRRSLGLRFDYLPVGRPIRGMAKGVLAAVGRLAGLLKREDEIVLIARKEGRDQSGPAS